VGGFGGGVGTGSDGPGGWGGFGSGATDNIHRLLLMASLFRLFSYLSHSRKKSTTLYGRAESARSTLLGIGRS